MTALDALAACSRAADRAICAAIARAQREEALARRAGPGARRRPRPGPRDRVGLRWRLEVLRNRVARWVDRLLGR